MDRHKYIRVAYHGFQQLKSDQRKRIYLDGDKQVRQQNGAVRPVLLFTGGVLLYGSAVVRVVLYYRCIKFAGVLGTDHFVQLKHCVR